jgi:hypothetical protein
MAGLVWASMLADSIANMEIAANKTAFFMVDLNV